MTHLLINLEVAIFLKYDTLISKFGSSNLPEINMTHSLINFCHPVVQSIQEGTLTLCAIMKASKNMKPEKEPDGEAQTAGTNYFC